MRMTQEQLGDFIKSQVVPSIKNELGEELSSKIKDQVDALATAPDSPWQKALTTAKTAQTVAPMEKGISLARCIRASAAAKMRGQGADGAVNILRGWGSDDLADQWEGARQKALTASDATGAGFLVPEEFSNELIDVLRSKTVVRSLGARTLQSPTGTINIPKITAGAQASYIGEATAAPKSQLSTGNLKLSFKKLAVLTPISNDLLRYSNPSADGIVRDDLVQAMRVKEDQVFIRSLGSGDGQPKGLRGWMPNSHKVDANATVNLANVTTDMRNIWEKLLTADVPMVSPGWIFSPRSYAFLFSVQTSDGNFAYRAELERGTFWGIPFKSTTQIPDNLDESGDGNDNESEVYIADFSEAIIAESMGITVDTSDSAAYHDGSSVVSAFSRDETAVRAIAEHDFGLRHTASAAMLQQVTMGV